MNYTDFRCYLALETKVVKHSLVPHVLPWKIKVNMCFITILPVGVVDIGRFYVHHYGDVLQTDILH